MRVLLLTLLIHCASASAETEIFRCPMDDGTVAFQETPCPEPVEEELPEVEEAAETAEAEFAPMEPISQIPVSDPLPPPSSQDRAECEKTARDEIDAIDLEMRASSYTREELENFKAELRVLTRQLRACKQL